MATRAQVASLAGVSETTVSYVITGNKPISEPTRLRVLAAMETLQYRPNIMAQGLAGGKSKILAMLFASENRDISNGAYEYVLAAASTARALGYHLLLLPTEDRDVQEVIELSKAGLVDGVILMEVRLEDERVTALRTASIPTGLMGRTTSDDASNYADRDFETDVSVAVEYLHSLGHTNIALFTGTDTAADHQLGWLEWTDSAFKNALIKFGIAGTIIHRATTIEAGRKLGEEFVTNFPDVTGLVCMNNDGTLGFVHQYVSMGYEIPKDLSVISLSFPDILISSTTPQLTSISPPSEAIGSSAVTFLIDELLGLDHKEQRRLWNGQLVIRESTSKPSR